MAMHAVPYSANSSSPLSHVRVNSEERLRKLPAALQPIFLRCKRVLTDNEWELLSLVTPEQRCAALGMQLEGQHVNSIIAYLLAATEQTRIMRDAGKPLRQQQQSGSPSGLTARRSSASTSQTRPRSISPSQQQQQQGGSSPALTSSPGLQHQRPVIPSTIASRLKLAMAPPILLRQQPGQHQSPRAGSRSPSGGRSGVPPTTRGRGLTPPPQLRNVALPRKASPGASDAGLRAASPGTYSAAARAVSPIAPPRFAPVAQRQQPTTPRGSLASATQPHPTIAQRTERALFQQREESLLASSGLRDSIRSSANTFNSAVSAAPQPGTPTSPNSGASPLRRSHSQTNVLMRRDSQSGTFTRDSPRDDARRRDYHHLGTAVNKSNHHTNSRPNGVHEPAAQTSAAHVALSIVRNASSTSSMSSTSPSADASVNVRLSPGRATRWQSDFSMKLRDVGLDVAAWCQLTVNEHDEFFSYWRMSQLQVAMVKAAYPAAAC